MIKGYVFFGTINVGGPPQEMLPLLRLHRGVHSILRFVNVKPGPVDLAGFFDQMASINNDFDTSGGLQIPSVCFYESKPTVIGGFNVCSPPELPWYGYLTYLGTLAGYLANMVKSFIVPREKAVLQQARENRPIDSTHGNMIKFEHDQDPGLIRVLSSLERLIPRALEWPGVQIRHIRQPETHAGGVRILCLDGGGVRGLFSALVLEAVMEAVRRIDTPDNPDAPKPCDYFDLICGTSTGGLLTIMLGRLAWMCARPCASTEASPATSSRSPRGRSRGSSGGMPTGISRGSRGRGWKRRPEVCWMSICRCKRRKSWKAAASPLEMRHCGPAATGPVPRNAGRSCALSRRGNANAIGSDHTCRRPISPGPTAPSGRRQGRLRLRRCTSRP